MARVQFEHIYKRFKDKEIVRDINLDIKENEFMVLVGPSGCGKSTCLRMVAGLEEPTDGKIYIGDRAVNGVDPKDRDIAMVFQNYALYPHMTVFDNIAFSLKLRRLSKDDIKKRVEEASASLGLKDLLKRRPKELSGGQRQRVALGRAIVRDAQVFLMDEPLSNLDAKLRVETRATIIRLHQRIQTTTIYVTHDQVEAMTMGDRITVLEKGIIQQIGTPQELYDHPANILVAAFIGTPGMNLFEGAKVVMQGNSTKIILDGLGLITVPALYAERAKAAVGKRLTFGVRPIHLQDAAIVGTESDSSIDSTVDVVENLGSELQVSFTTLVKGNSDKEGDGDKEGDKKHMIALLNPRSRVVPGNKMKLYVNTNNIHLFDTDTGKAFF
jgi:multiple sugar transport system ATP-binding protein